MGGNDGDLRSKTRTIEGPIRSLADSKYTTVQLLEFACCLLFVVCLLFADTSRSIILCFAVPDWNFDGSSTNQAPGIDSEVLLR